MVATAPRSSAMKLARRVSPLLGVVVVGAFVVVLAGQVGSIREYSWQLAPQFLALAAVAALARGAPMVYPWWRIVRASGSGLPWGRAVRLYFHSGLARYLPGQWWFVLGRAYLAEREGVRAAVTASSTAIETVMLTGSALAVASLGLATAPRWSSAVAPYVLLLVPATALALLLSPPLVSRLADLALRLARRDAHAIRLSAGETARVLVGCLANWLLYGLVALFLLAGLTGGEHLSQAAAVVGIFAASVLGGSIGLLVPQGIGIREGVLVYLLSSLLGVPVPVAVAVAALTRLFAMGAEGLWALAGLKM
ncbi:MAG: lysylphosphatidylglycerol synthase domain-containing protein [Chloroflexia bacterium]